MDQFLENCKKIARRVFEKEGLTIPVNIKALITKYADLEETNIPFGGDAICINREDRSLIIYNKDTIETRLRFTFAHELGHIKIPWHTGMILCETDEEQSINENEYLIMERQANAFASELLMPKFLLDEIIAKYEDQGLEAIINQIYSIADVSFLAASYATIDTLPQGYVIFIENLTKRYTQKLTSNHTDILFLYEINGSYNKDWLEINSIKSGLIERENENLFWFNLGKNLSEKEISNLILAVDKRLNLTNIFQYILDRKNVKPAIGLPSICKTLPKGYIIKITLLDKSIFKYIKSDETYINPKLNLADEYKGVNWCNQYSINKGIYYSNNYTIDWWQFDIATGFKFDLTDKRESKIILRDIIDRNCIDEEKKSKYGSINGIIGVLNNKIREISQDEFYSILKQKFLGREDLDNIINDNNFDGFLIKKTLELYNKIG